MATRNVKKIVGTVLALGAATGAIVFGSFAAWTATTSNTGNSVQTGTLKLTNNTASAKITATNVFPGGTGNETFKIINDGTSNYGSATLKAESLTGDTALQSGLNVSITQDGTNIYSGPLDGATLASGVSLGSWNAGTPERVYVVSWELPTSTPNATQGKTAGFTLTWDASLGS